MVAAEAIALETLALRGRCAAGLSGVAAGLAARLPTWAALPVATAPWRTSGAAAGAARMRRLSRRGLLAVAVVIVVLGQRRAARAGEQDQRQGRSLNLRLHGSTPRTEWPLRWPPSSRLLLPIPLNRA
jgi:hypothetical protein